MATYERGSKGEVVQRIQGRLKELNFYLGGIDGDFGGGTESAVKAFQQARGIDADGVVGPATWGLLFPNEAIPESPLLQEPLDFRCLALTGCFETNSPVPECFAGLSGDFDGQGISFGVLQWNFGQGSLQPLLLRMNGAHPDLLEGIFHDYVTELRAMLQAEHEEQLSWCRSVQDGRNTVIEPWKGLFKTLGRCKEFEEIERDAAGKLYQSAIGLCTEYDLMSERAVALMFDIKVQNGSISPLVKTQIEQDFTRLTPSGDAGANEAARLRIVANRRAEAANPKWVEDVRTRKLTIANGQGTVHGCRYDLEGQFGIGLKAF